MCDQTEVNYGDGDVVWAKIGRIWWPGVVVDAEKGEKEKELVAALKVKPIAIVKFFDEEKYEFVKNLENIYHYNCRRKDEFIKIGLNKYRGGAQHMSKFPGDVTKAETLVHGDPDIISNPKFAPSPKTDYNEIFGSGKKKKRGEEKKVAPQRKRFSAPTPYRAITSDQRASLRAKHRGPLVEKGASYSCPFCTFTSTTVSNISTHFSVAHSSSRIDFAPPGYKSDSVKLKEVARPKTSSPVKKKTKSLKPKISETKNETPVSKPPTKKPVADVVEKERKKRFTDALLADWSDDDEDVRFDKKDNEGEIIESSSIVEETAPPVLPNAVEKPVETPSVPAPEQVVAVADKKETVSCFDFDEEDEGFIGMSDANTYGRKIPRVIPVKDKTDLGMDLEIEELFKRKPEVSDEGEKEAEAVVEKPKRRGRRKKSEIETEDGKQSEPEPKKAVTPAVMTMASTRERRSGARKSYVNQIIEKVDDSGFVVSKQVEEDIPSKTSRRKQDLKRSSLVELDELNLVDKKKKLLEAARITTGQRKKKDSSNADELALQVESLLAETSKISIPSVPKIDLKDSNSSDEMEKPVDESPDVDASTVEYLEEEGDKIESELAAIESSPRKVWTSTEEHLKKSSIYQWQQGIRDALKTNREPVSKDRVVVETPLGAKLVTLKGANVGKPKGGSTYILVKPQSPGGRPKILGKTPGQQLVVVKNPRVGQQAGTGPLQGEQRLRVFSSGSTTSQPLVQLISDKSGGKKLAFTSKKVIQFKQGTSPQKIVLSGNSSMREGLRVIENYNGTGRTVFVKEMPGSSSAKLTGHVVSGQVLGKKLNVGGKVADSPQYIIKRIKRPDGRYTIQTVNTGLTRPTGDATYVMPQQPPALRQPDLIPTQETMRIITKPAEPVVEPMIVQAPIEEETMAQSVAAPAPQVVAMPGPPGPDGQPTYILLTVDEHGGMHTVDSSMVLAYDTQGHVLTQQDSGVLTANPAEELTPTVYSTSGQDILAEALANTNVLGDEPLPSLMIPPALHEQSAVSLATPSSILTSLGVPPTIIADSPQLVIAPPVVQETSVTLQKPIMTPVEVPTAIVLDTSGLQPPPLPPTPTEEDVLMEEPEGGLMIAEPMGEEEQVETQETAEEVDRDFFIDDSQGEEANSFHSMPLLNEESTASEEPIGDQSFETQSACIDKTNEYLPSSTNPDLEEQQDLTVNAQEDVKDGNDMPFITEENFTVDLAQRSQETEVSSTTGDSKDAVS